MLDAIALEAHTDKASSGHNYTKVYESYLKEIRELPLLVFELGVGGYQYPERGGESLRMWAQYFPNAKIVGIDVYEKNLEIDSQRVAIWKGSQDDPGFLNYLVNIYGNPDLIIDDASHVNKLTIRSFEILFPLLKAGGLYFVEDIHTSFWFLEYGGDPDPMSNEETTIRFFQRLTPQLCNDTLEAEFRSNYSGYLEFIHFYRNLVIIKKK